MKLRSMQHQEAHPEGKEEPIKDVSKKVKDQMHASKRSPGQLRSKYFQYLFRSSAAFIAKRKQVL